MTQPRSVPIVRRRAAVLIIAMVVLLVLTLLGGELVRTMVLAQRRSQRQDAQTQALWLAESGVARALVQLEADAEYDGETWQPTIDQHASGESRQAKVTIVVETAADSRQVRVEAVFPDHPTDRASVERVHSLPPAQEESP